MLHAVTVTVDIQTLDPAVPAKLMGRPDYHVGDTRRIPGGILVFQAAFINDVPAEVSAYRFVIQFGSRHSAAAAGAWLFGQLNGQPVALSMAGRQMPIEHGAIVRALKQMA